MTAMPISRPRSSTSQPLGASRAAPIAAANTARYASVRFASIQLASGWIDQVTDSAVSAASTPNKASVTAPERLPGRPQRIAATATRPQPTISAISTAVALPRTCPPLAANATAANAAPSPALAAAEATRDDTVQRGQSPAGDEHRRRDDQQPHRGEHQDDGERERVGLGRGEVARGRDGETARQRAALGGLGLGRLVGGLVGLVLGVGAGLGLQGRVAGVGLGAAAAACVVGGGGG